MGEIKLFYRANYTNTKHSESKVRTWLQNHQLDYQAIPVEGATYKDIFHLLFLSEGGIEDIISKRSKYYKELCAQNVLSESMSLHSCVQVILAHPELLRTPIVFDDIHLQIGFNSDEIRQFIPREVRNLELQ